MAKMPDTYPQRDRGRETGVSVPVALGIAAIMGMVGFILGAAMIHGRAELRAKTLGDQRAEIEETCNYIAGLYTPYGNTSASRMICVGSLVERQWREEDGRGPL